MNSARRARRRATLHTVERALELLGLTARVPSELIASASMAFVDGLAVGDTGNEDARASFDVFWLAILSLCD